LKLRRAYLSQAAIDILRPNLNDVRHGIGGNRFRVGFKKFAAVIQCRVMHMGSSLSVFDDRPFCDGPVVTAF
jgi:hypothetical protein